MHSQYPFSTPIQLLPITSPTPVIPPSPTATALSTSELLLTTLAQAVSFITVMGTPNPQYRDILKIPLP
ncbi:hypothetical protein [Providencia hangzhouensis]|uniref:hypothetical protein n=1 Tax=Providencia hangzhouensis TaxID=3031799 RepID=UPI0034DD6143